MKHISHVASEQSRQYNTKHLYTQYTEQLSTCKLGVWVKTHPLGQIAHPL